MKANEKKMILILIIITIILIIVKVNQKSDSPKESGTTLSEYVEESESGLKQSTSDKLNEVKTFGEFEMGNIKITELNGKATLTASVTNMSASTQNEFPLTINLMDKKGNVLEKLGAYVGTTKPGESRGINASINMDISEIYDIEVEM